MAELLDNRAVRRRVLFLVSRDKDVTRPMVSAWARAKRLSPRSTVDFVWGRRETPTPRLLAALGLVPAGPAYRRRDDRSFVSESIDISVEQVARAICKTRGLAPDLLIPWNDPYGDGQLFTDGNVSGGAGQFQWRSFAKDANAAIRVIFPDWNGVRREHDV